MARRTKKKEKVGKKKKKELSNVVKTLAKDQSSE